MRCLSYLMLQHAPRSEAFWNGSDREMSPRDRVSDALSILPRSPSRARGRKWNRNIGAISSADNFGEPVLRGPSRRRNVGLGEAASGGERDSEAESNMQARFHLSPPCLLQVRCPGFSPHTCLLTCAHSPGDAISQLQPPNVEL